MVMLKSMHALAKWSYRIYEYVSE